MFPGFLFGHFYLKGGEKLKEEKLEQLKTVFRLVIKNAINKAKLGQAYFETDEYIQKIVEGLIYEVRIRINSK